MSGCDITKKHNTANDNFGTVINAEVDLLGKQHAWDVSEVIARQQHIKVVVPYLVVLLSACFSKKQGEER